MTKLLFVIHALGGGGAEKVLINLVKALDKNKYDITLMTIVDSGIYRSEIPSNVHYRTIFRLPSFLSKNNNGRDKPSSSGSLLAGAGVLRKKLASIYLMFWRYFPAWILYRIAIRNSYDVEIAFLEGACTKLIASSKNKRSKKLAWVHVDIGQETKSQSFYKNWQEEKKAYEVYDEIICVSQGVEKSFVSRFPSCMNKTVVSYNPIDIEQIRRMSLEECQSLDIQQLERPVFLSIGRICGQKAFDRVVELSRYLRDRKIKATFLILGEGPDRDAVERLAERLGVTDSIKFVGFQSNPYPFFRLADIFLCTSIAEGFSTTACEAAILGLPIITTNCAGMDELRQIYGRVYISENSVEGLENEVLAYINDGLKNNKQCTSSFTQFSLANSSQRIASIIDGAVYEE